ncbi:hypothetical protein [Amycolatopsis sp. NBC_01286]|uniref:hypothetical protein n=1 Tax=Amycolatopsis sp. NBC_01286 TaxID=2903560 RepID=UPI002E12BC36|nr:hypothetical protein OG570_17095 [Amycolatopsis sp. NBC_01286]
MPTVPSWSPSARIAKFREKAAILQANPLVQKVTHVRTQAVRLADGTFQVEGTRADPDRLRLLMLDARVFEQRNDSGGVALETINNVVVQELKRLGFDDLAKKWGALRKAQREERNRWYKPSGKKKENELYPADLVDLQYYGDSYHLDYEKAELYTQLGGVNDLLIHQAVLQHLLLTAKEVRGVLLYLDRFEAAGVEWGSA